MKVRVLELALFSPPINGFFYMCGIMQLARSPGGWGHGRGPGSSARGQARGRALLALRRRFVSYLVPLYLVLKHCVVPMHKGQPLQLRSNCDCHLPDRVFAQKGPYL